MQNPRRDTTDVFVFFSILVEGDFLVVESKSNEISYGFFHLIVIDNLKEIISSDDALRRYFFVHLMTSLINNSPVVS